MAKSSLRAKFFYHYLLYTEAKHHQKLDTSRQFLSVSPHQALSEKAHIRLETKGGHPIWRLEPKEPVKLSKVVSTRKTNLLYLYNSRLHQGIRKQHWEFLLSLLDSEITGIMVPEIPLNHDKPLEQSVAWIREHLCPEILNDCSSTNDWVIISEGSSALFSFYLLNELAIHRQVPLRELILISPWLDCSFSNPLIENLVEKDPIHNREGYQAWLSEFIQAESTGLDDSFFTPIYQKLTLLPPIKLYSAGRDILQADASKLKVRAVSEPIVFNYYEYSEMFNEWYHYPIPERDHFLTHVKAQWNLPMSEWERSNELDSSFW